MVYIFFIYGLSFFTFGLAVLLYPKKIEATELEKNLWLIGAFGLLHGSNEWVDMFRMIEPAYLSVFNLLNFVLLPLSYIFLLYFGLTLITKYCKRALCQYVPLVTIFLFSVLLIGLSLQEGDFFLSANVWSRYLFGIPGIFLTAHALFLQKDLEVSPTAKNYLLLLSFAFFIYGILAGVIVPSAPIGIASIVNQSNFQEFIGLPVQLFRALCAFTAAYAAISLLRVLRYEIEMQMLKSKELAVNEAEKVHRLNTTLEQRVEEEVAKNREKDHKMIQQAKFAQMGEMLSMIAHQWRQPLTAISATSTGILLKAKLGALDTSQVIEQCENISRYSQHLSMTIDDFRNFFKPNKEKQLISCGELIQSVLNLIEVSLKNKNIRIVQEVNCDMKLMTYENEMKQVLLNLLKNAEDVLLERAVKDPTITIKSYAEGEMSILEIQDNGGGIPKEIVNKIFDPYFSTKTAKNGTGLGLYMSKTIIEEHCGGRLSVENGNEGAIFRITFRKAPHS